MLYMHSTTAHLSMEGCEGGTLKCDNEDLFRSVLLSEVRNEL